MCDLADLPMIATRFRLKAGDLAYRAKLQKLSEAAQMVLYLMEADASGDDIVDRLARRDFHQDPRVSSLTKEEIRAAEIKFVDIVREIRAAFQH